MDVLLQYRGAATDQKEAQELAKALCATGVVLRFRNNVFLRPEEVMQSVLRVSGAENLWSAEQHVIL
jgi:hypothetical protein